MDREAVSVLGHSVSLTLEHVAAHGLTTEHWKYGWEFIAEGKEFRDHVVFNDLSIRNEVRSMLLRQIKQAVVRDG